MEEDGQGTPTRSPTQETKLEAGLRGFHRFHHES